MIWTAILKIGIEAAINILTSIAPVRGELVVASWLINGCLNVYLMIWWSVMCLKWFCTHERSTTRLKKFTMSTILFILGLGLTAFCYTAFISDYLRGVPIATLVNSRGMRMMFRTIIVIVTVTVTMMSCTADALTKKRET